MGAFREQRGCGLSVTPKLDVSARASALSFSGHIGRQSTPQFVDLAALRGANKVRLATLALLLDVRADVALLWHGYKFSSNQRARVRVARY